MSTKGQSTPVSLVWAASSVCSGKKGRSGKNWERALALAELSPTFRRLTHRHCQPLPGRQKPELETLR